MTSSSWSFVLVAAGRGSRLGGIPKQFRCLEGIPLWRWSLSAARTLREEGVLEDAVLVVPPEKGSDSSGPSWEDLTASVASLTPLPVRLARGGAARADSVIAGLRAVRGDRVLVHDAARPFLSPELCRRLMEASGSDSGAVPLLSCPDALKEVDPRTGEVLGPADRSTLRRTQTPQAFPRLPLLELLEGRGEEVLDEAQAWLEAGRSLASVEGDPRAFKITDSWDWEVAQHMAEEGTSLRCGHGFDVHPLVPGRSLVLGGVLLKDAPLGLEGHSDADVICHAVSDALLGAAGEPDIGLLFPASEERYRGADSLDLLRQVVRRVRDRGGAIRWVDVTLQAQIPRLKPHLDRIRRSLEGVLRQPGEEDRRILNLKVKSGEFVGSVGRGECMVCHAVATLVLPGP